MLINQRVEAFADYCKQHANLLEFATFMKHTIKQLLIGY